MWIAAAGMDRVIDQRTALGIERDAPDEGVEPARHQVERMAGGPGREPERVDKLQRRRAAELGPGDAHVSGRFADVDSDIKVVATLSPGQPADAVIVVDCVDDQHRSMLLQ